MKYIGIILLILVSLASCKIREPDYIDLSNQIMNLYLKDMKEKHSLYCFGVGGGFMDKVNRINVAFKFYGEKNYDELRELLVETTEEFLNRYNENEKIRPFLKNYPFTAENFNIGIHLVDHEGRELHNRGTSKKMLCAVSQSDGIVRYSIQNDEKLFFQEVHRESYEDALRIVKNENH